MELIDTTELKTKRKEVEENYKQNPNEINKVRLAIIFHETSFNLSFPKQHLKVMQKRALTH